MLDTKRSYSTAQVMRFLVPSVIGAVAFILPISINGSLNTILGLLINIGTALFKPWLPKAAMTIVVVSALITLYATLVKPKRVMESEFMRDLFVISPFWLISRLLGAIFYVMIIFQLGPKIIWGMATGGTPGIELAPALLVIFAILAFAVPLLTDYGLMEYVGTFARPIMHPLFRLPGRAAVDCLASWVGSSSVAVVITTKVHDQGYYSDREGATIATSFSVISIAYIYVMASFVKLPHMYFQLLFSIYVVSLILAFIMPRIWPLASIPDTFSGREGQMRHGDELPPGYALKDWALKLAVERAEGQTFKGLIDGIIRTLLNLIISTMPLVISWGTIVLIITETTPIFQTIALPFGWMLDLVGIPEAKEVGVAFILGFADQFLSAVIGSGLTSEAARFMCAGISATGLVYMTEVGVLILNSSIPLGFGKLAVIYAIRAVFTVFLLAPFAHYFCG